MADLKPEDLIPIMCQMVETNWTIFAHMMEENGYDLTEDELDVLFEKLQEKY